MEREQISEDVIVKDPRTVEECVHASDLLNLVLVSTHIKDTVYPQLYQTVIIK